MAEDAVVSADESDDIGTEEVASNSKSPAADLHAEVQRALKDSGGVVRARVIQSLVEEKLEEHKKLVLDALGKVRAARGELASLEKKGTQLYGVDKKPAGPMTFTKEQLNEIEKVRGKVKKLEDGLELALGEKADYSKLKEAVK
jgi:hypothetical protein